MKMLFLRKIHTRNSLKWRNYIFIQNFRLKWKVRNVFCWLRNTGRSLILYSGLSATVSVKFLITDGMHKSDFSHLRSISLTHFNMDIFGKSTVIAILTQQTKKVKNMIFIECCWSRLDRMLFSQRKWTNES